MKKPKSKSQAKRLAIQSGKPTWTPENPGELPGEGIDLPDGGQVFLAEKFGNYYIDLISGATGASTKLRLSAPAAISLMRLLFDNTAHLHLSGKLTAIIRDIKTTTKRKQPHTFVWEVVVKPKGKKALAQWKRLHKAGKLPPSFARMEGPNARKKKA